MYRFQIVLFTWMLAVFCRVGHAYDAMGTDNASIAPQRALPGIIGHDDRVMLDSTAWPWQALGRVNQVGGYAHCTGTLVTPDTVLTAAHCVYSKTAKRWLEPDEVIFVAGMRREENMGFARGRSIIKSAGVAPDPTIGSIAHDWAMIRLEHGLPGVNPVAVKNLADFPPEDLKTPHLQTAGYSLDRPFLLSLEDGCAIQSQALEGQVLVTNCDSTQGDSGAPLLLRKGKDVWVIGVFSAATLAKAADPHSFAVNASSFIKSLPAH